MKEGISIYYAPDTVIAAEPTQRDHLSDGHSEMLTRVAEYDPLQAIIDAYSTHYIRYKDHSPLASRISLIRRARDAIATMGAEDFMLDIGSGRQVLEKQYKLAYGNPRGKFVTFDIAVIPRNKLLLGENSRTEHVRGNGNHLPFADDTMGVVVSNMALDFMNEDGLDEILRVTKPGGRIFVNLCFSYLDYIRYFQRTEKNQEVQRPRDEMPRTKRRGRTGHSFWQTYLRHESVLITDPTRIVPMFSEHGFSIERVGKAERYGVTWWELDMRKPEIQELVNLDIIKLL